MPNPNFLHVCERAARAGGQVLLDMLGEVKPSEKGPKDLVTEADIASQDVIREIVLSEFPDHLFLGEEDTGCEAEDAPQPGKAPGYCWIVDPLDGTTNFVHRMPSFAVSIALEYQGEVITGVVFDPCANECYTAARGRGAALNGQRLATSDCHTLNEALVATGFATSVKRGSIEIERFIEMLPECQALRRLGSAALNLCYVASGRMDGYWATSVKAWDVAAGSLILTEAGGSIRHIDGGPFSLTDPRFSASANETLLAEMHRVLQRAEAGVN